MHSTALREAQVLLLGVALAFTVSLTVRRGGMAELLLAIVVPLALCIFRMTVIPYPRIGRIMTTWKRVACQILLAIAIVLLLLFEMLVGLFAGPRKGIPWGAWAFVFALGAVYVGVMTAAEWLQTPRQEGPIDQ
jgi:hypothetical protein